MKKVIAFIFSVILICSAIIVPITLFTDLIKKPVNNAPYNIVFVADEVEVSVSRYIDENSNIYVPEVPYKLGYDGKWETYKLSGGDITVNAVYTPIEYKIQYCLHPDIAQGEVIDIFAEDSIYINCKLPDVVYPTIYTIESEDIELPLLKETFECACKDDCGKVFAFTGYFADNAPDIPHLGYIASGHYGDEFVYVMFEEVSSN